MASQIRTSPEPKTDRLLRAARRAWTPPPRISVPEWADRYRKLAKEAGSTSGRWRTSTVEIARGPMLAVTEPGVETITAMSCTQLMKTALLENIFGYFAHLDPCPMLLLQPKEEAAQQFSKERITPLISATPVLRALVGSRKTRNKDETILSKTFPGGFLALAGAGSPDNVARRPIRILLCDEVDKYPITKEGPVIPLAEERLATFGADSLSVRACSPTIEDESAIAASYAQSDQRRASVVCPHCAHRQFPDFFKHVHWGKDDDNQHQPETAQIHCEACGVAWSEGERLRALKTVRWHQTRPFRCCGERHVPLDDYGRAWTEHTDDALGAVWDWSFGDRHAVYRAKCPTCGTWPVSNKHAGFTASKLFSPWPKDKPANIAAKYLAAKSDQGLLQSWWNTQQGLPFRPHSGKTLSIEALASRGERWDAEVPDGVGIITIGGDVQTDRVEMEVVGWGRNEESWSLAHEVFEGDPDNDEVWNNVDEFLMRRWHRADGRPFAVSAACIDTGGASTQKVYQFCKARLGRKIWGVKGESARTGTRSPVWPVKRPTARNKAAYRPVIIGVNAAKDTIRNRLHITEPGPGYMHVPADRDINWYAQLTAERLIVKDVGAQRYRVWDLPSGKLNEALDCRVYAYAALCGLQHFGLHLNRKTDSVGEPTAPSPSRPEAETAQAVPQSAAPENVLAPPAPIPLPAFVSPPTAVPRQSRWVR